MRQTARKGGNSPDYSRKRAPARDADERERQMISLAIDLAEQQLMNGTATSQVITHYLKLATRNSELERRALEAEVKLKEAKTEALQAQKQSEETYRQAIEAFQRYSGQTGINDGR